MLRKYATFYSTLVDTVQAICDSRRASIQFAGCLAAALADGAVQREKSAKDQSLLEVSAFQVSKPMPRSIGGCHEQ